MVYQDKRSHQIGHRVWVPPGPVALLSPLSPSTDADDDGGGGDDGVGIGEDDGGDGDADDDGGGGDDDGGDGDDGGGGNGSPSWFPFLHPLTLVSARLLLLVRLQPHHYALLR